MRNTFLLFFLTPLSIVAQAIDWDHTIITEDYSIYTSKNDPAILQIHPYLDQGIDFVTQFLRVKFKKKVNVYLFPDRDLMDQQWQQAWGYPGFKSECWMVGSGLESRLDLLSPTVWSEQACEHDPNDTLEIKRLIIHELTHVLHSDCNRSSAFDNIDNIDWFVEGLATYVSGQLDKERISRMIAYIKETGGPTELSQFWAGEHKYGLSGSLVAYIDTAYGRKILSQLLEFNKLADILQTLSLTEAELIEQWKKSL